MREVAEVVERDVRCQHCGYNLRGLNPRHRCPECGQSYVIEPATRVPRLAFRHTLSRFERACAVMAFALGVIFLISGAFGTFIGVRMSFELPPVLGAGVALVGWGIVRSVIVAWQASKPPRSPPVLPQIYQDPLPPSAAPIDREIDRMRGVPSDPAEFDPLDELEPPKP